MPSLDSLEEWNEATAATNGYPWLGSDKAIPGV